MAGVWREGGGSGWGCPPFPAPISPHLGSCVPDRTMASAATEAEKGSPVVVGLLVVGNFIILVRPPPVLGAQWVGGEEGTAQAWGGVLRAQDPPSTPQPPPTRPMLQAVESEQPGFLSQLRCFPALYA